MTSVDLMREHPPRAWWTACPVGVIGCVILHVLIQRKRTQPV